MKNARLSTAILLLALTSCTESIYMKDPKTSIVATCGNHPMAFPIYATIAASKDQDCVQNYKEQGYVRVPAP